MSKREKLEKIYVYILIILSFFNIDLFTFFIGERFLKVALLVPIMSYLLMILYGFKQTIRNKNTVYVLLLSILPFIFAIGYSAIIWIGDFQGMPYLTRAISNALYMILALFGIYSIYQVQREKTIDIYTNSIFIIYLASFLFATVYSKGNDLIMYIKETFLGVEGMIIPMKAFYEIHEILYIAGALIIFYAFKKDKNKSDINKLIILSIIFIFGFKRIGIVGLLFVLLVMFINNKAKILNSGMISYISCFIMLVTLLFVGMIYNGFFFELLGKFGINDMGRKIVYEPFLNITEFTPLNLGKGFGFVSRHIETLGEEGLHNMSSIRGLHNNYLELFIDLGFIGFLVWQWLHLFILRGGYKRHCGLDTELLFFYLQLFAYVTYATDNTMFYRNFQMVITICPIVYYSGLKNNNVLEVSYESKEEIPV